MTYEEMREKWKLPVGVGRVGDGWAGLIDEALCALSEAGLPIPEAVSCVKEKLAGLRIYLHTEFVMQEPVMRILHDVEVRSYSVCETCGEHGSIRTGNWLKVLCEIHGYGRESFSRPCIYRNCEHPAVLPGLTCEKHRNATLEEVIAMLGEHDETK